MTQHLFYWQENMLLMVHLFPDNLIGWPIYAHRNMLSIMMDVMIHWQSMKDWGKDQVHQQSNVLSVISPSINSKLNPNFIMECSVNGMIVKYSSR